MSYPLFSAVVGSQAHGLATPASDTDTRGVFITSTSDILTLGPTPSQSSTTVQGHQDDTFWEIGHFLALCVKSNPNTLEVMKSPYITYEGRKSEEVDDLLALFPHCWSSRGVYDAARGMGLGQRGRIERGGPDDPRLGKHGVAWVRTIENAISILTTGDFSVVVGESHAPMFRAWKAGKSQYPNTPLYDQIMQVGDITGAMLDAIYVNSPKKHTDYEPINDYLLSIRQAYWD